VRSALSFATHDFFRQAGFACVHTPIITASDCAGAGEAFRVTTLPAAGTADVGALEAAAATQGSRVRELKAGGAAAAEVATAVEELRRRKGELAAARTSGEASDFFGSSPEPNPALWRIAASGT
jgi:asparaginyl-tRNA synthetase